MASLALLPAPPPIFLEMALIHPANYSFVIVIPSSSCWEMCCCRIFSFFYTVPPKPVHSINGVAMLFPDLHHDLGIPVNTRLTWTNRINKICSKAYPFSSPDSRTLIPSSPVWKTAIIIYISLVRSNLAYCSQLWKPVLVKDIQSLEQLQRRATKYILQDYSSDYNPRLVSLNMLPLMY